MTAESTETMPAPGTSRLARSLRLAAGVVALLLLSEAIWLWQTWPVRQLVRPQSPSHPIASGR